MGDKTAFVTGGTGFIGLNLVEELVADGWDVVALHRSTSDLKHLGKTTAKLAVGDVTDRESVLAAMPEGVDAVFHVAGDLTVASGRNEAQERINVEGTRNVIAAARERNAKRFVHTSSISAWGEISGRVNEKVPQKGNVSPISYHRTKWQAEQDVRQASKDGLEAVILNPMTVLGKYAKGGWAGLIILMQAGLVKFIPPGAMSFSHGRAVARAHISAAERGRVGENYLLGGVDATLEDLIRTSARIIGCEPPSRKAPAPLILARGYAEVYWAKINKKHTPTVTPDSARFLSRRVFCDSSKAIEELGYEAVDLETIVRDTCEWMLAEGLLKKK